MDLTIDCDPDGALLDPALHSVRRGAAAHGDRGRTGIRGTGRAGRGPGPGEKQPGNPGGFAKSGLRKQPEIDGGGKWRCVCGAIDDSTWTIRFGLHICVV